MNKNKWTTLESEVQGRWEKRKTFEADADDSKDKFFINYPIPYVNGLLHVGHAFTATRCDVLARYKRMKGCNVLYPQGWHCTGTPLTAAARRVKEGESSQIEALEMMGILKEEIPKFGDVQHWVDVFVPYAENAFRSLGISIDWRRSFLTSSLNPVYDKFIRWQFEKLKENGYLTTGKHPVVWCPNDKMAVGDHDRSEGEGEMPQEFTLLKFDVDDYSLMAATLRPETVFGQTNLWVNPDVTYTLANVDGKQWVVSQECFEKLKYQKEKVEFLGSIDGKKLIGKKVKAPLVNREIPILPATFCKLNFGTGIVTSVPSDAPYDYVALRDLQTNLEELVKYDLNVEEIKAIQPIPIINSKKSNIKTTPMSSNAAYYHNILEEVDKSLEELIEKKAIKKVRIIESQKEDNLPAKTAVEKMKIKNQNDPALEELTNQVYKKGFYTGSMNENCGPYAGELVEIAKDDVKHDLINAGEADVFYDLSKKVFCRCLSECVIKIVSDQWFIAYGNKEWKEKTKDALSKLKLYPETIRPQFEHTIDWLKDWACARERGTGTKLPWDEKWTIESLSDSTIYMAYYTISKYLEHAKDFGIDTSKIDSKFFDFIFLDKGDAKEISKNLGIDKTLLGEIKHEFEYWYPFEFRGSGKDLVQNHLTFSLFNHVAIFPEKYWPKGFGINGWLLVDEEKMSKSKGNFYTIKDLLEHIPADAARISLMEGGEGLADSNFNPDIAYIWQKKLSAWYDFALENYNKGSDKKDIIDDWMESKLSECVDAATEAFDKTNFRTALTRGFYDIQNNLAWYLKRKQEPNKETISKVIEYQTQLLAPFAPHITEDLWSKIGKDGLISESKWPISDTMTINPYAIKYESIIKNSLNEIYSMRDFVTRRGSTPQKAYLYVNPKNYKLFDSNISFFEKQLGLDVFLYSTDDPQKYDPKNKSVKARDEVPGIYLE